jgi:hypothetical protein
MPLDPNNLKTFPQRLRDTSLNVLNVQEEKFFLQDVEVGLYGEVFKDGILLPEPSLEAIIWINEYGRIQHIAADNRWLTASRSELVKIRINYLQSLYDSEYIFKNKLDGEVLHLIHPFFHYEFGHLFDTLQKICVLSAEELDRVQYVIVNNTDKINRFSDHLSAIGLGDKVCSKKKPRTLFQCSKLFALSPIGNTANFSTESYDFIRGRYYSHFRIKENHNPSNRIFLSRLAPMSRPLSNATQIHHELEKVGIIILTGDESLEEHISIFSSASHIAGIHGSLFANSIFATERTQFLEYCPSTRLDYTFINKYKKQLLYKFIPVTPDGVDNSLKLDIEGLLSFYFP